PTRCAYACMRNPLCDAILICSSTNCARSTTASWSKALCHISMKQRWSASWPLSAKCSTLAELRVRAQRSGRSSADLSAARGDLTHGSFAVERMEDRLAAILQFLRHRWADLFE